MPNPVLEYNEFNNLERVTTMPFINTKVSVPLTAEKEEAIKRELGEAIAVMGKGESFLMVGFEDNVSLFFGGERQEKCAFVDVRVFGSVNPAQASAMTEKVCAILGDILAIPADKVYVTYQGYTDWGWNGRNF